MAGAGVYKYVCMCGPRSPQHPLPFTNTLTQLKYCGKFGCMDVSWVDEFGK